ncbi:MAG: ketoreductase, partial [Pseudonocardiales bacterium]|nr:ketoreductase [Pseudonocardiales bacterium]
EHLGKALEAQWRVLGTPSLDEPTTALLREQAARDFGPLSDIPALETRRDRAQIALMKALAELPATG